MLGFLRDAVARFVDIVDESGAACRLKLEGIEQPDDDESFDVVADVDCHDRPALGALLRLRR